MLKPGSATYWSYPPIRVSMCFKFLICVCLSLVCFCQLCGNPIHWHVLHLSYNLKQHRDESHWCGAGKKGGGSEPVPGDWQIPTTRLQPISYITISCQAGRWTAWLLATGYNVIRLHGYKIAMAVLNSLVAPRGRRIYIYILSDMGLGHLGQDMGPWARAHGPISQPKCPRPILINIHNCPLRG